jgi:hypothetical protein
MKYSELLRELEYWKEISDEEDPEIVANDVPYSYEIVSIQPVKGVKNNRAIGILFK